MDTLRQQFREALEAVDRVQVEAILKLALTRDTPLAAIERLVVPVMESFGADWDSGKLALSQVYMGSRLCEQVIEQLLEPGSTQLRQSPRIAIVVLNDYHMLGKRIVHSVLRASGYDILDYGRMEVDALVDRIAADTLDILLISVLMLPSALKIRELRMALDARNVRVRIAVGGAPFLFDSTLWQEVGADTMGRTAGDAISIVKRWAEAK